MEVKLLQVNNNPRTFTRARSARLLDVQVRRSLAASDGELEHTQDDTLLGKGGRGLDITGNIPQQKDIGRVSSWAVGFERLLQDTMGLDCFTQFLKVEFSEENIMFWIACEQMSKIHDKSKLEKHAHDIYEKYLSPKATHPVNLEGQCQEMVEAALKNPTPEIFRNQQQQIFKLMKFDSYSRFLKSKMYQDCVLAEMAGEPLPIYKKSPATDSSKLTAAEEKANKKKSQKKKNRKQSESSDNSVSSDTLDKRRRPVLPWNKVLPGKGLMKRTSGDLPQEDDSISRTSNTSDAAENSGLELGTHGKYQKYSTAVRFQFPNNDTVTLPARSGCSVRDAILPLCEARQLPIQALEIFQSDSKESKQSYRQKWKRKISTVSTASSDNERNLVDLEQELSTLAGAEVVVERRIIFKIELPNHRVIGVKSKPTKKIIEVLRPVTYKYKLMLDSLVVHLSDSPVPLDLDITVASLDGQRILIETMEQYSAGTYKPQNGQGRLFKAASTDSIVSKVDEHVVKNGGVKQKETNNNTGNRPRTQSEASQKVAKDHAKLIRSPSAESNAPLAGIKKRGNLRVTGQETEDLIAQLSKANRRMDDQRGLTIKDLELPDFLKQPEKSKPTTTKDDIDTRAKTSLGAPYEYDVPEFLKSYEAKRTSQAAMNADDDYRRSKSTPPTKVYGGTFNEGSIPTHDEAEALFGSSNGSIAHMHFNDSMLNLNGTGTDTTSWGSRPSSDMRESGVSFHSSHSDQADKFSPRSYQSTLQKVAEHSSHGHLEWDLSDINDASFNQHNSEADTTLVATSMNHSLPPPPTPENLEDTLELANYSPPPPVSANRRQLSTGNSLKPQGSTIPGHNYNQNHNVPQANLEDPMLRYNDTRSPGPPSPSTHDLVVSPGSGDQDPSFADGSQLSYSTGSTVTESSVHFGNSSYSGHSTYSSNSSQSRNSSAYNRPPGYPRTTSDLQIRQAPPYSRTASAPQGIGKVNPVRPRYPPPPIKPKPAMPSEQGASGGATGAVNQRGKARNEMIIIGKNGRKMRASFV